MIMNRIGLLIGVFCTIAIVNAHVCLYNPPQRGGYDLSFPGARECFRKQGPCGMNVAGDVKASLVGGKPYTIQFQQNLNHYTVAQPGYLDASIALVANPREEDFQRFGQPIPDYNAYNMITQTNFSITDIVPNVDVSRAVIRIRYLSNNPKEAEPNGTIFYNCADISIKSSLIDPRDIINDSAPKLAGPGPNPCCTTPQWTASTYQTGSWRAPTVGTIAYDAINKLMRIDTVTGSGHGTSVYDGFYKMYLNFTSGYQWFYDVNNKVCYGYHLDVWQDWCYGTPGQSQSFFRNERIGDSIIDVWQNGEFYYSDTHDKCTPTGLSRNGDLTLYTDFTPSVDPSLFVPDPICHRFLKSDGTQPQQQNGVPNEIKELMMSMGVPKSSIANL